MTIALATQDEESIAQCIRTILLTNPGEVPFKPEMGVGSHRLIDGSMDKMKISLAITTQLNTYEPRIQVKQVQFLPGENVAHLRIAIKYKIKSTGEDAAYFFN